MRGKCWGVLLSSEDFFTGNFEVSDASEVRILKSMLINDKNRIK